MVSAYCFSQIDSSRKGTKRADFDLFGTAVSLVWARVAEKVQVLQVGQCVVGSCFDFGVE
jgi:hypothetical protein